MNLIRKATAFALPLLVAVTSSVSPALAVPNVMAPKLIPGSVAQDNTSRLTSEIHWYQNLSQAEAVARRDGKLVFWMHMLGHLDGAT